MAKVKLKTFVWMSSDMGDANPWRVVNVSGESGLAHVWVRSNPPPRFDSKGGFVAEISRDTALALCSGLDRCDFADGPVEVK